MNVTGFKWYEELEPGIRALVYFLRNNGFNTICSCEHIQSIQIAPYRGIAEVPLIHDCLRKLGYKKFEISAHNTEYGLTIIVNLE